MEEVPHPIDVTTSRTCHALFPSPACLDIYPDTHPARTKKLNDFAHGTQDPMLTQGHRIFLDILWEKHMDAHTHPAQTLASQHGAPCTAKRPHSTPVLVELLTQDDTKRSAPCVPLLHDALFEPRLILHERDFLLWSQGAPVTVASSFHPVRGAEARQAIAREIKTAAIEAVQLTYGVACEVACWRATSETLSVMDAHGVTYDIPLPQHPRLERAIRLREQLLERQESLASIHEPINTSSDGPTQTMPDTQATLETTDTQPHLPAPTPHVMANDVRPCPYATPLCLTAFKIPSPTLDPHHTPSHRVAREDIHVARTKLLEEQSAIHRRARRVLRAWPTCPNGGTVHLLFEPRRRDLYVAMFLCSRCHGHLYDDRARQERLRVLREFYAV